MSEILLEDAINYFVLFLRQMFTEGKIALACGLETCAIIFALFAKKIDLSPKL